jgi:hypothetical protein
MFHSLDGKGLRVGDVPRGTIRDIAYTLLWLVK